MATRILVVPVNVAGIVTEPDTAEVTPFAANTSSFASRKSPSLL